MTSTMATTPTMPAVRPQEARSDTNLPAVVYPDLTPAEREHEALVACADNLRAAIWDWQEAAGIDSRHTPADYRIFGDKLRALYEDAMALAASREGTA